MDTKVATTQIRIQQWTEIIQDRSTSGLTVDDYCESHGFFRNQYYYWLRKVKARILESAPQLVELKIPETIPESKEPVSRQKQIAVTTDVPQLVINKGDIDIRVNSNISPETAQDGFRGSVVCSITQTAIHTYISAQAILIVNGK